MPEFFGFDLRFVIAIVLSLAAGYIVGIEREARGKVAGISTNCFVIGGSAIFTYLSALVDPNLHPELPRNLLQVLGSWVQASY